MFFGTHRRIGRLIALIGLATLVLPLCVASAAPAVTPFQTVTVSVHDEQQGNVMFITGTLPVDAALPAAIEIPAPANGQVQWAGEILGGDLADDITVEPQSRVESDTAIHAFTLTKARIAQLEAVVPGVFTPGPSVTDVKLRWVPTTDVQSVTLQVRLPQNAGISVPAEGAQTTEAEPGFVYYSKTFTGAKAGQPLELALSYVPAAGGETGSTLGAQAGNSAAPVLIMLIAVGAFAAFGYLIYRKSNATGLAEESAEQAAPVRKRRSDERAAASSSEPDHSEFEVPDDEIGDDVDPRMQAAPRPKGSKLPLVISGAVIALIAVLLVVSTNANGGVGVKQVTGDAVVKVMAKVDADASVVVPIKMSEGGDVEHESDHVFQALQTTPGVGKVSVALDGGSVSVEYASGQIDEAAIKAALANGGYPPAQ